MPELADGANPRQGIEKERCQKLYLYSVYTENRLAKRKLGTGFEFPDCDAQK